MNQLNSLILEGTVCESSVLSENQDGVKVCRFTMSVSRWHKNRNGEGVSEVSKFPVEVYGRTAEFCDDKLKRSKEVRVVGWLKEDNKYIFVVAEHIEFKPEQRRN